MTGAASLKTTALHPYQYGCRYRPFHGGDVALLERNGISVRVVPASETPAEWKYMLQTDSPVPRETRNHFDLEVA
jgi:hypothetical protein